MAENIDWEFIASLEGKGVTTGYVPNPTGSKSGVTIATGFDLGARNENDLTVLGLSADLITKFKPYLGLQGTTADEFLKKNPLTITEAEAADIDKKVKGKKVPAIKQQYINSAHNTAKVQFDDLPSQAQTVIASVSFQYGSLPSKAPKFWTAASSQDWTESVKILRAFGDSYPTRRGKEADLLEQVVKFNELMQIVMSLNKIWFTFLFVILSVGCSTSLGKTTAIIFDENLSNSYKNYDSSATEARKEIAFESGAKVANCQQYWSEKEKSSVKEDIANMMFKSEYLLCDALQILKKAEIKSDNVSQKSAENFAREIYSRLDLTSFPLSFAQTLDENNSTLKAQKSKMPLRFENNSIVSDTKDWYFALKIVAAADVNKNGKQDLIVWVTDKSKEGNLQSYSTILIYDVENQGILKAATK